MKELLSVSGRIIAQALLLCLIPPLAIVALAVVIVVGTVHLTVSWLHWGFARIEQHATLPVIDGLLALARWARRSVGPDTKDRP